jgi:hypothetical protein
MGVIFDAFSGYNGANHTWCLDELNHAGVGPEDGKTHRGPSEVVVRAGDA